MSAQIIHLRTRRPLVLAEPSDTNHREFLEGGWPDYSRDYDDDPEGTAARNGAIVGAIILILLGAWLFGGTIARLAHAASNLTAPW